MNVLFMGLCRCYYLQPLTNLKSVSRNERNDATDPKGLDKIKQFTNQSHSPNWVSILIHLCI